MPESPAAPASASASAQAGGARRSGIRGARYFSADLLAQQADLQTKPLGATWRGWVLGLLAVAFYSAVTPYAEFWLKGTPVSANSYPMSAIFAVFILAVAGNLMLRAFRTALGLTRQDLTLVFCMTMVTYVLPFYGFMQTWSGIVAGPDYLRKPENDYQNLIYPHLNPGFFVWDPVSADSAAARPVKWFYEGLPPDTGIPWASWAGPFSRWALAILLLYGVWFSIAALLRRRWSEQEKLPFPVVQAPEDLIAGFNERGGVRRWLFTDKMALWGFGLVLAVHLWNCLGRYETFNFLEQIPMFNRRVDVKYFSEPPWNMLGRVDMNVVPTMIGLTFLLSREVAFSLWFFWVVKKVFLFSFGLSYGQTRLTEGITCFGTGALLMLALISFWAARTDLARSFYKAFTPGRADDENEDVPLRWMWLLLLACGIGLVAWLKWFGLEIRWAVPSLLILVLIFVGMARLMGEAGAYSTLLGDSPSKMLTWVVAPATIGARNFTLLTVWDRVLSADFFRIVPLSFVMNAFHFSGAMGLRLRSAMSGMAVALVLALGVTFFAFLGTLYGPYPRGAYDSVRQTWVGQKLGLYETLPAKTGGATNGSLWYFRGMQEKDYDLSAKVTRDTETWERKEAQYAQLKQPVPEQEIPDVAKPYTFPLGWAASGAGVLVVFNVARQYLFWWPHPAGLVMWMCSHTHDQFWFAFFLGWFLKWAITSYGGKQFYLTARRFFIGAVVGEAVAVLLAVIIGLIWNRRVPLELWLS